jgi:hypothetical protein
MKMDCFRMLAFGLLVSVVSRGNAGAAVPTDAFVVSRDTAVYGKRVGGQQIPAIARVGSRWFCTWYGVNTGKPGSGGERAGCYNILAVSDDDCATWKEVAYFIPNPSVAAQSVIDPRIFAMPDGQLLFLIPVSGQKGRSRSAWAMLLTNPLGDPEGFVFGEPKFVDFGFTGSAALIGGRVFFTANQDTPNGKPPPWFAESGMKLHRVVSSAKGKIETEFVSRLPYAAADGSLNSCFEVSLAETGPGRILAFFRTTGVQHVTRSEDGGKTWSAPAPFAGHPNARSAKADLARSPSGRLVLAFNRNARGRYDMCVAISSDGGETWPDFYVFDARRDVGPSYPNVAFGADAAGKYDGNIYVAYDHGRGRKAPDFTKEITVAKISEDSVVEGRPTHARHVVSR